MSKYKVECYDNKDEQLTNIANELAEANRLKRLELDQHSIVLRDEQIPSVEDLKDQA